MAEDIVRAEQQRQAASQASVANAITSLRLCTTIDWREYVESVSLVENVLRRDPGGHVLAHGLPEPRSPAPAPSRSSPEPTAEAQIRVALKAVETARQVAAQSRSRAAAHVGYHLIGRGRAGLELDLGYRPKLKPRFRRFVLRACDARCISARSRRPTALLVARRSWLRVRLRGASPLMLRRSPRCCPAIPASELALAFVQQLVEPPRAARAAAAARARSTACRRNRKTIVVDADAAHQRRGRRVAARTPRSGGDRAIAIRGFTSRCSSDFADAASARRRRRRGHPRGRARSGIEALNARAGRRCRAEVLPVPPRSAVERARAGVDGMGAQARQARGVQPPGARRHRHQLHDAGRPARRAGRRAGTASRSTPTRSCRAMPRAS